MRHVLSSQYEQFRNYQESEEMLHMMQHDLKHQIEGLRGETNEQKREAWLDKIENELDKPGWTRSRMSSTNGGCLSGQATLYLIPFSLQNSEKQGSSM